jgi:hypothetical protein
MVDFVEALKRPFSDGRKFLIGIVLGMIPLVNFIVIGYKLVSTGFTSVKVEKDGLPEWRNYGDLFIKGLISAIIGFLLYIPVFLVFFSGFGAIITSPVLSTMLGGFSPDTWNRLTTGEITDIQIEEWFTQNWMKFIPLFLTGVPFLILGVVLGLLASYIMPVVILGWLKEGSVGAGFSWNVIKKAFTMDYLGNWFVVRIIAVIVSALLGNIPFLGLGITTYVIGVFSFTVFAEVYENV